jgi:hypothetical protein
MLPIALERTPVRIVMTMIPRHYNCVVCERLCCKRLLLGGFNIMTKVETRAVSQSRQEILLGQGIDISTEYSDGSTVALEHAAVSGSLDTVKLLLSVTKEE